MSDNKLPRELVDRMLKTIYIKMGGSELLPELSKQCAQIAVDYADNKQSEIDLLRMAIRGNDIITCELKKQRDELVDFIEELVNNESIIHYSVHKLAVELIKKHEDGKE